MQTRYEKQIVAAELLHQSLSAKYPTPAIEIPAQEQANLKNALLNVDYTYSLNNMLHYINEDTAALLAESKNTILNFIGSICRDFYLHHPLNKYNKRMLFLISTFNRSNRGLNN